MDLYVDMLGKLMEQETIHVTFPDVQVEQVLETRCYQALSRIQAILKEDGNSDAACFQKIEEIVRVYEALGSGCGTRHDFG